MNSMKVSNGKKTTNMIRFKTIFFIFCLSMFFTNCKKVDENKEAEVMLAKFYKSYIGEVASYRDFKQMNRKLDSLKKIYCTKSLIDSINVEYEDGLDYDPFINAQDADSTMIETLSVSYLKNSKNKYVIRFNNNFSKPKKEIFAKVINENGQLKISSLK